MENGALEPLMILGTSQKTLVCRNFVTEPCYSKNRLKTFVVIQKKNESLCNSFGMTDRNELDIPGFTGYLKLLVIVIYLKIGFHMKWLFDISYR